MNIINETSDPARDPNAADLPEESTGFLIATDSASHRKIRPLGKRQERFPELVTLKENLFAMYVALGLPFNRAYELAGYGGSPTSRRANACRLSRKPNVTARIRELVTARSQRLQADGEREMEFLQNIMMANPRDLFDDSGRAIKIQDLPRTVAAAIRTIRPTKHGTMLQFHDQVRAAEVRLRVLGRLKEAHTHAFTLEDLVAGMSEPKREDSGA